MNPNVRCKFAIFGDDWCEIVGPMADAVRKSAEDHFKKREEAFERDIKAFLDGLPAFRSGEEGHHAR